MKTTKPIFLILTFFLLLYNGCQPPYQENSFGYDQDFLEKHKEVIVLKNNNDQCQVLVIPDYQGRVMTSTAKGLFGKSHGWINYELVASGNINDQFNPFGGEDRFWLGPEGGQYSIFFEKDEAFTLDNWNTPPAIDTEPFQVIDQTPTTVEFNKKIQLTNYHGFKFSIDVNRTVSLLDIMAIENNLSISLDHNINYVAFESHNRITNQGSAPFTRDEGLLSIWILGMFKPSEETVVMVPYKDSLELNTAYFGAIGADRLAVKDKVVLFKGDGKYRSKIGLPPKNVKPILGSYDPQNQVLTIVEYSFSGDTTYVNSLWELQENPYEGDVVNSYNDGPLENGDILGPFYELETSSSAKALQPGQSMNHIHRTYHFEGIRKALNPLAKQLLGIDLEEAVIE